MSRVHQSTIPTFNNETSKISSLVDNTILFCQDFNSSRKNFIVVDETALRNNNVNFGTTTVQLAYDNGWIEEFPNVQSTNRIYYKWTIKGSDINAFGNYCLYQDVLNDKTKFALFENGLPFGDWDLLQRRDVKNSTAYASHIDFNNGHDTTATYEIHYWEDIKEDSDFSLSLYREASLPAKNTCIPLTIRDQHAVAYYLDEVQALNYQYARVIYKDFAGIEDDIKIDKTYSDRVIIKQFPFNVDLTTSEYDCNIEVWTGDRNGIGDRRPGHGNDYSSGKRYKGTSIIIDEVQNNRLYILALGTGKYKFRIRFNDNTFSNWIEDILDIRKYNLWSTDATVSQKNYEGFVYFPKIK